MNIHQLINKPCNKMTPAKSYFVYGVLRSGSQDKPAVTCEKYIMLSNGRIPIIVDPRIYPSLEKYACNIIGSIVTLPAITDGNSTETYLEHPVRAVYNTLPAPIINEIDVISQYTNNYSRCTSCIILDIESLYNIVDMYANVPNMSIHCIVNGDWIHPLISECVEIKRS